MVSLFAHLGLGDTILLSGAVVQLVERYGDLRIFCYPRYHKSVASFFAATPRVRVVPLGGEYLGVWHGIPPEKAFQEAGAVDGKVIRCGAYGGIFTERADGVSFPELFYRQLQVPYGYRWKSCPLEQASENVPQLAATHPIFVHDDGARGYHIMKGIDSKPVYRPVPGHSVLAFTKMLRSMAEIHCIDSCFYHLVESLGGITAQLFYHRYSRRYVRGWCDYPRKYNWVVLP